MNTLYEYTERLKQRSKRLIKEVVPVVGYTCSYVPPELIYAAGFLPERIVGRTDLYAHIDSALSCNLCPYVHGIMKSIRADQEASAARRFAAVVLVDSCDAMRKLYDAIELEMRCNKPRIPVYLLSVPRKKDEKAVGFFALQLEDLLAFLSKESPLSKESAKPLDDRRSLKTSTERYSRIRSNLSEIRQLLCGERLSDYLQLKQMVLDGDPVETLPVLESIKRDLAARFSRSANRGRTDTPPSARRPLSRAPLTRIAVSGSPVPGTGILSAIEEAGFRIVVNDSCLDERWDGSIGGTTGESPFLALARAYLEKIPCARMLGRDEFLEELSAHARHRDLAGLIQLRMPFCDLYGYDHVRLVRTLPKEKVLQIETDGSQTGNGQVKTRIYAFYEMLTKFSTPRAAKREISMERHVYCGMDVGSTTVDGVLLDTTGRILAWAIERTGPGPEATARQLLGEMLASSGASESDIVFTMATGYGREGLGFADGTVTEISCHARGIQHLLSGIRFVIDIGGQDSKVIRIDDTGEVKDFQMNDKCAAGTGRFLEVMAGALGVSLEEMGLFGMTEGRAMPISSVCTVFAESEVVSMIGRGIAAPDITRGLYESIINRIEGMVRRVGLESPVAVTGGGALNRGLVFGLEKRLATPIAVPETPQLVGAIGASLYAMAERGVIVESPD